MALCSQADIEALRQIDITAEPDATATALIGLAEGILEGVSGRRFDPVADQVLAVEEASWSEGSILLPHYPVAAVEVRDPDDTPLDSSRYLLRNFGVVSNMGFGTGISTWDWQYHVRSSSGLEAPWPRGYTVVYTGGIDDPDDAPRDLRTLCAQVAADLFDAGSASIASGGGALQSESLGGWSVSFRQAARGYELTPTQRKIARSYAHKLSVVAV